MNEFADSASAIVLHSHEQLHLLLQDSKDLYSQELESESELFASISELNRAQILAALKKIAKDRVQAEQSQRKPTLNSSSVVSGSSSAFGAFTSPQSKTPQAQGIAAKASGQKKRHLGSSNSSSKSAKITHSTETPVSLVVGVVKEWSEQEFLKHAHTNTHSITTVGVTMLPAKGEVKDSGVLGNIFFFSTTCGNDVSLGHEFFSDTICSAWNVLQTTDLPPHCPFRTGIEGGDKASQEEEEVVEPVLEYKIYEVASDKKISKVNTTDSSVLQSNTLNYESISKVTKANGIRFLYLFGCNDSHHDDESKEVGEDLVGDYEADPEVLFLEKPPTDAMRFKKEFQEKKEEATKGNDDDENVGLSDIMGGNNDDSPKTFRPRKRGSKKGNK